MRVCISFVYGGRPDDGQQIAQLTDSTNRVETFLLFSRDIPSQNLGFVDARASKLELTVAGRDYVIHQSPTVLSSNRAGGTTGAGEFQGNYSVVKRRQQAVYLIIMFPPRSAVEDNTHVCGMDYFSQ